jgi:hypothetical protein
MRGAGPQGHETAGTNGNVAVVPTILVLLALGLALRLIIAYVILPGSGFPSDLGSFQAWSRQIADQGPVGFYGRAGFLDYPPVYLILLGILGFFTGPSGPGEFVKVLPILADAALAAIVWQMAMELGASQRRALVAAAVFLFNPITWFNSAIWGQADAVGSVLLLLGLRELIKDRRESAAALAVLATLTKLQLGILGFLVGFVILRRSLWPRTGEPDPLRILTSVGVGLGTGALVCLPFTGLDFGGLAQRLGTQSGLITLAAGLVAGVGLFFLARRRLPIAGVAARTGASALLGLATVVGFAAMVFDAIATHIINTFGEYPYLTLNAYNPWALVADEGGQSMARNSGWIHDSPWTDPGGYGGSGYVIGPFSSSVIVAGVVLILALLAMAALAWFRGRAAVPDETERRRVFRMELQAVGVGAIVLAGVIAYPLVAQLFGSLSAAMLGDGYLLAILVLVSIWAAWRDDERSLIVALAILAIAFFAVPTRSHERYLFPFFCISAILLAVSWRWTISYVALAIANTVNLLAVLVQYDGIPGNGGSLARLLIDWGTWLRQGSPDDFIWPVTMASLTVCAGLVWVLMQMRGRSVETLAREALAAGAEPQRATAPPPAAAAPVAPSLPAAAAVAATGLAGTRTARAVAQADGRRIVSASASHDYAGDEYDDESGPQPELVPASVMRLWHHVYRRPARPDRSAALDAEPHGRIDKLDIWIVVVLVIAVLSLRVFRLDEPTQMHFDEVYFGRTGTEFLQEWRYGIPHDIYEWTHPHVSKYAAAVGIAAFSDYKVTATSQLGVPVQDALVQPRFLGPGATGQATADDPRSDSDARLGDRLYVATGSEVRAYDLQTRQLVATFPVAGASALAMNTDTLTLYVGTSHGAIYRIDLNSLDDVRLGVASTPAPATAMTVETDFPIALLYAGSPGLILAVDQSGQVVSIDAESGAILARADVPGASDFAAAGSTTTIAISPTASATSSETPSETPTASSSPTATASGETAEARALADALHIEAAQVQGALDAAKYTGTEQRLDVVVSAAELSAVQAMISEGTLPHVLVSSSTPVVLVAYEDGLGTMDARHLVIDTTLYTSAPATSIALNSNTDQDSYVAAGDSMVLIKVNTTGGTTTVSEDSYQPLKRMPGRITQVAFDDSTRIVHALGQTPDGKGWTVYAIESNGNAVFADAPLSFEPIAFGIDTTPLLPGTDHHELLAVGADGRMAAVDVGQFAFSWRIVGVLFGALMAACMYLLARVLFRRRSVGMLVALFSLLDGMLFVQSRIATPDTYTGGFMLLAYLIFASLWLGVWKNRLAFWIGMPLLGTALGLSLSSKWVAMYAIASIGVLILIRSALGRWITILALAVATASLGWQAVAERVYAPGTGDPAAMALMVGVAACIAFVGGSWAMRFRATPDRTVIALGTTALTLVALMSALTYSPGSFMNGAPNYTFFLIMLGITVLAAAVNAYHPIAWTVEETRFAIVGPMVVGVALLLAGLVLGSRTSLMLGAGGITGGIGVAAGFALLGRWGFGPLARPPAPDDPSSFAEPPAPAPTGWLRLGSGWGIPAIWTAGCVLVLPIIVYVVLYIPWAMPWQPQTAETGPLPSIVCLAKDPVTLTCTRAWPEGHTGQQLSDLTIGMYNYHNDLTSPHAASSPWWAWPLDLKPVWFESINYGQDSGSMIYDGGNPALWWLGITAMCFVGWQAFKRRSPALALILIAFLWQWLSWVRIARAAFEYHFYTPLPFYLLALAFFLAELWHGPSRRTWLLARVGAAAALVFMPVMWLAKGPLCELARVGTDDYYKAAACGATAGDLDVKTHMLLILIILVLALVALAISLYRIEGRPVEEGQERGWMIQLMAPVVVAGILMMWVGASAPRDTLFKISLASNTVALLAMPFLTLIAALVLTMRDTRRFVLGFCVVATIVFVAFYPNVSALPMPDNIKSVYNGLLPTWLYGFEFSVNLQPAASVPLISNWTILLTVVILGVAALAAYAAWIRRVIVGYRRHLLEVGDSDDGEASEIA